MQFIFLHSQLLAAAAAAAVPLVLHLLHRRRARNDHLPTLRFLRAGAAANKRRMRLKHVLVLVLRVTAVLLLVATLARPAWIGEFFSRAGTAPVNAVIVVDNSISMAYQRNGGARFDRAKTLVRDVLANLSPGARIALVVTGLGPRGENLDKDFVFRTDPLEDAVDALEISAYGGDCVSALRRAYSMLTDERPGEAPAGREVYVVSDLAAHAWSGMESLEPPGDTATVVLDAGSDENENFSIGQTLAEWRASPAPAHIEVSAEIISGDLAAGRLVEVSVGGAKRAERLVDAAARSRTVERFTAAALDASGTAQGFVTLAASDPLVADNTRYFTVPATRGLTALVVGEGAAGPAFFIASALEPSGMVGATGVRVVFRESGAVAMSDIEEADVIVVADAGGLGEADWGGIERAVLAGKGLILWLGEDLDPRLCAEFLEKYFGVRVGAVESAPLERSARLEVLSYEHPMLKAFAGGRNGNLAAARVYRWRVLESVENGVAADQMARIEGAGPAMLAAAVGRGRAVVAAFAPSNDSTDLQLRSPFVPFVHEMVRYAAGGRGEFAARPSSYEVGSSISFPVEASASAVEVEVVAPLDRKPAKFTVAPGGASFSYRPFFPGNYSVRIPGAGDAAETGFSVNAPLGESLGDRVTTGAVTSAIANSVVVTAVSDRPLQRVWGRTRGARELFDIFLVATLAVLALEEYLANRSPRGGGA